MNKCILITRSGPFAGCKLLVNSGDWVVIGRQASRGLSIGDDIYLSREHFRIFGDNGQFRLVDNNSRNGTYLNGEKVDTKVLSHGDCIRAGGTEFLIVMQSLDSSNTWMPEEGYGLQVRTSNTNSIDESTKFLPGGLAGLSSPNRTSNATIDEVQFASSLQPSENAGVNLPSQPALDENRPHSSSLIATLGFNESNSKWLANMSLEPLAFSKGLYCLFEFKDPALVEVFLRESRNRVRLSVLISFLELPKQEWTRIRSLVANGHGETLAEAWAILHDSDASKISGIYKQYMGKDAAIVVGTPVLSKVKNQEFTKNGGPLSYPSVLLKTIRKENLVLMESLLRTADFYLFENTEKPGSTVLFLSPKFFELSRFSSHVFGGSDRD
jgi:hypothetical protein